jgi:putative redox protein
MGERGKLTVQHLSGDQFRIDVRGHWLLVDQPENAGGEDAGPTPTELFVGSLAACVGHFARRFMQRHELPTHGLAVECDYEFAPDRPSRVGSVVLRLTLPEGFPEARREALAAVVEHCTVHNSIVHAPRITLDLVAAERVA